MKVGDVALHTCVAPAARSSASCSGLRTMLTRSTRSLMQMRLSIWPRLDAAAVCTSALWPSRRIVSTMPSAVSGLTKHDAPSAGVVPGGSTRHCSALTRSVLRVHGAAEHGHRLAEQRLRGGDAPASITTPAPSLPTGSDWPSRPAIAFIARSGTRAVTTVRAPLPVALERVHVGGAEQQAHVGRVDRRGLDPHHHLVGARGWCRAR